MVCDAVSRRAAHMCASGVAAIATKIHANRPDEYLDLTCGVDGSVYKKHPTFSKFLQVNLSDISKNEYTATEMSTFMVTFWKRW